ncbi:MAG: DUF3786 domain-containing protein [Oscillospiraceae bacterium]|nr:DUF3786 domain-containing protein [Oscillospiraceae bacterium]
MKPCVDNYAIQASQAKRHFLTYDQQELIRRCNLNFDDGYFYIRFLGSPYRICRHTGNTERQQGSAWVDGNGFGEVMTILDWLCDSRADRSLSGNWINVITAGAGFHTAFQEESRDPYAECFDKDLAGFSKACEALGGERQPGADISYAIELVDGLKILVQFWQGDEEFSSRVRCLWDGNVLQYIRYETTFYAVGLLLHRIKDYMEK